MISHLIWAEPEAFDAKSYAIYILTDGTIMEKRELLFNLKSRLTLKNKLISLAEEKKYLKK